MLGEQAEGELLRENVSGERLCQGMRVSVHVLVLLVLDSVLDAVKVFIDTLDLSLSLRTRSLYLSRSLALFLFLFLFLFLSLQTHTHTHRVRGSIRREYAQSRAAAGRQ